MACSRKPLEKLAWDQAPGGKGKKWGEAAKIGKLSKLASLTNFPHPFLSFFFAFSLTVKPSPRLWKNVLDLNDIRMKVLPKTSANFFGVWKYRKSFGPVMISVYKYHYTSG